MKKGSPCETPGALHSLILLFRMVTALMAGRAISADQMAHSAVRVMPPCIAMGQAAGTAAGLAVSSGKQIRQIDITQLQRVLRQNGVYLPETDPG